MPRFGDFEQYFNNSGDILNAGKLYFYESGPTTTLKTTYADINQTTPNPNPVILTAAGRQGNIWFDGVAKVVLTTSADVILQTLDPVGETDVNNQFSAWVPVFNYPMYSIVLYDGIFYVSLVNNNIGNTPDTSPTDWQLASDFLLESQTAVGVGQVAVGSASTGLAGVPAGADGTILSANSGVAAGVEWATLAALYTTSYTEYLASDTFPIPVSAVYVYVEAIGGGGGGGGGATAGGGGGGGFNFGVFRASDLSGPVTVTIGAGGTAGSAGAGGAGGNTTFGSYLTARGGAAGGTNSSTALSGDYVGYAATGGGSGGWSSGAGAGGAAGAVGGSCIKGGAGGGGAASSSGGAGGTSLDGGAGGAASGAGTGTAGTQPGGGGGGGGGGTGGVGGAGRVRVWSW